MDEDTPQPNALSRNFAYGSTSASARPALSVSYSKCLELYQHFLRLLGTKSCLVVHLEQVNVGKALEEYGRFQIWGEQTRAALPERTRRSLDDTLQSDESLKDAVSSILGQLSRLLSIAIPIAEKSYDNSAQDSESSMSADSNSELDSELDSDQDEIRSHHAPNRSYTRVSKISVLMNHVFEQVQLLYNLSLLLNRPGLSGRYLRSTSKNEKGSELAHFAEFDYKHICEKFRQWKGKFKIIMDEEGKEETVTTAEDLEDRKTRKSSASDQTEILCRRLAKANTRRREQLQYWIHHPDRPDVVRSRDLNFDIIPNLGKTLGKVESVAIKSETATIKKEEQKTVTGSQNTKSMASKQSFSTVAVSDVFDKETKTRARTIYAQSTVGNKPSTRVPEVPKTTKTCSTFRCPYCSLTLESKVMADRLSWKRHVFRDLRPYVCTFLDCLSPDQQYLTRHDWIYHEQQMHRRQWMCTGDCHEKFPTKILMTEHLRNNHSSSLAPQQLPIIVAMSERPIDEDQILACPLCPDELYLGKLQTHLAEHLETISLFVLPVEVDEDEDIDSNDAARTGPNPDQDKSSTQATLSSLGFSQTNETGQTEAEFSKLLSMAVVEDKEKCETWGAIEAISAAILNSNIEDTSTKDELVHSSAMTSMANLAAAYRKQGLWKEANELDVQKVETNSRVLGLEHPDTLASMTEFGLALKTQGEYVEAVQMYQRALSGYEKALGLEHTSTLDIVCTLGYLYTELGQPEKAVEMYQRALQGYNKVLGPEHVSALDTIDALVHLYVDQGQLEEAEKMYKQLLEGRKKTAGPEHPNTLMSMNNLAQALSDQGRYAEGEKMHQETLALRKKVLGKEHPLTLNSMSYLAQALSNQGKYAEAERMHREMLALREKIFRLEYPDTLMSMSNIILPAAAEDPRI